MYYIIMYKLERGSWGRHVGSGLAREPSKTKGEEKGWLRVP